MCTPCWPRPSGPTPWTPKDGRPVECACALDARIDGAALAGALTCTVRTGPARLGTYTFAIDGRLIGSEVAGTYTSALGGEVVKRGKFNGGIVPAP